MEALTPVIVSASRATDVPACYADWFLRRLRAGGCVWVNRFSGRRHPVSFARTRAVVFWTKNPAPLLPRLAEVDDAGLGYYFTFTLNDYGPEGLEPGLPPLAARIETFLALAERLGPERVVWRYDPIVVGGRLGPEQVLERVARVGAAVRRHTRKLVVSFVDVASYPSARRRLREVPGGPYGAPAAPERERVAAGLGGLGRQWGLEVSACAEREDLSRFGIGRNRCVDDALLARAFPGDAALQAFLRGGGQAAPGRRHPLKDRGQRRACGCVLSKDIGSYGTCPHGCAYCYANASHAAAAAARVRHDPGAEAL